MILQILSVLSVIGTWQYVGFQYEGNYYPNPNPKLVVIFEFEENGISHLKWHRKGENGFCEREAQYKVEGEFLHQKVVWVNPGNHISCSKDPDMQLGSETKTKLLFQGERLGLVLSLKGQDFIYLLEEVSSE